MTASARTLTAINLLGAVVSISLFIATFFAQGFIGETARTRALDATRSRLEPVVRFLENPKLAIAFPASVEKRLEEELAGYREDPDAWLLRVADGTKDRAANKLDFTDVKNPLARKALDVLNEKLSGAREHFRRSYTNLIRDLRIFFAANAAALLVAAGLLWIARTRTMRHWLGAWSVAILLGTITGVWIYLTQNWWWNVVFDDYYGWSYLAIHLAAAVFLFLKTEPVLWEKRPESD